MSELTTAAALFAAPVKRRFKTFSCSLGTFRLQSLTAHEEAKLTSAQFDAKGQILPAMRDSFGVRRVIACCVDADGNRVFADDQLTQLMGLDGAALGDLILACVEHCDEVSSDDAKKN